MPVSKAQQKAVHKYTKENYDRFLFTMKPKGRLEEIKAHAAAKGESTNAFIGRAVQEAMDRDNGVSSAIDGRMGGASTSPSEAVEEPKFKEVSTVQPIPRGTLKVVEIAAKATGENPGDFISRAVTTQAEQDKLSRKMKGEKPNEHAGKL